MFRLTTRRAATAAAFVLAPLLCGAAYWGAVAPPSQPGIYLLGPGMHLYPVAPSDVVTADAPETLQTRSFPDVSLPSVGALPASLYLYAPDRMVPPVDPSTATVWYVIYDRRPGQDFHTPPARMNAALIAAGDGLWRIDSAEFSYAGILERLNREGARLPIDRENARAGLILAVRVARESRTQRFLIPISAPWP